jgi:predicted amidohydrolase
VLVGRDEMTSANQEIQRWRACCVQMASSTVAGSTTRRQAWEVIENNLETAAAMIERELADSDAKLFVLPEMAFQGPPRHNGPEAWLDLACCPVPGPITEPLQKLAVERGVFVAGNQFERDDEWPGWYFNTGFLIDATGTIVLRHRRICTALWPSPHDALDAYLTQYGLEGLFPVAETELGKLAMVICGEISVPESVRVLMLRGAEVILHPTNEPLSQIQELAKESRAIENMVYVVSCNVAGPIGVDEDGSKLGGRSKIIDHRGGHVADVGPDTTQRTLSGLIDLPRLRADRWTPDDENRLVGLRLDAFAGVYSRSIVYPSNGFSRWSWDPSEVTRLRAVALENMSQLGIPGRKHQ